MPTKTAISRRKASKRGVSLVEIAIVLGIMGVVTYGVWSMASHGWEQARREQAEEALTGIVTATRAYYAGREGIPQGETFATTTSALLKNHVIPGNLMRNPADCKAGGTCLADTPWGGREGNVLSPDGTLRVCGWELGTRDDPCATGKALGDVPYQFFGVAFMGLNMGSCIALASKGAGSLGLPGLVEVNINGCNMRAGTGACVKGAAPKEPSLPAENLNAECGKTKPAHVTFVYRMTLPTN